MRSFGKPIIAQDKSTIEYTKREKDWEPPPPIEGYVKDSQNPWKYVRIWPECSTRDEQHKIRLCGRLVIVAICKCPDCPLFCKAIKANDCRQCEHRQ